MSSTTDNRLRPAGRGYARRRYTRRGIRRLLWPHVKPQSGTLTLAFLLGLSIAALSAAQPLLTRVVIDQGLIGRQFPRLVAACLGMLAVA